MWNLLTLDGYFEGAQSWELGWHDVVWGEEMERSVSINCAPPKCLFSVASRMKAWRRIG
jgi:hypothetical protein